MIEWKPIEQAPIPDFDAANWYVSGTQYLLAVKTDRWCHWIPGHYGYTKNGKGRWKDITGRTIKPTHFAEVNGP